MRARDVYARPVHREYDFRLGEGVDGRYARHRNSFLLFDRKNACLDFLHTLCYVQAAFCMTKPSHEGKGFEAF